MKTHIRLARSISLFGCLSASLFPAFPSHAYQIEDVLTPDGTPFVRLHIYQPGESSTSFGDIITADTKLPRSELDALKKGVMYWHSIIGNGAPGAVPVIDLIPLSEKDDNASAYSPLNSGTGHTRLTNAFLEGLPPGDARKATALITIDRTSEVSNGWYTENLPVLPHNGMKPDLPGTMLHELFHALGLTATNDMTDTFTDNGKPGAWTSGLHDIFGTQAQPGMKIVSMTKDEWKTHSSSPDTGTFYMLYVTGHSGARFNGIHVDDVLNNAVIAWPDDSKTPAVTGLPVKGYEDSDSGIFPELSHIELQNSLMSHQAYRNWATLMEAELAVVQDLGFNVDRRRFFGYSVYNSGTEGNLRDFANNHPFYERNETGDGWLTGIASSQAWGIGLHVYGNHNRISQQADLLTRGDWGMGIRIDGTGNELTIENGVSIQADGLGGNGLLVSYGKNHQLVHRGDIQALGKGGVGARFDFGSNEMGDYYEYRGSYIRHSFIDGDPSDPTIPLPDALKGALVDSFDVSGRLAGNAASIYISPNALISRINILSGASLEGDIISAWNPEGSLYGVPLQEVPAGADLTTRLSFGQKADLLTGKATGTSDPDFSLTYNGNILGAKSLRLSIDGGKLAFNGVASVLDVVVKPDAILSGNATYLLHTVDNNGVQTGGSFTNGGTVSNTNRTGHIAIGGDYVQNNTGTLLTGFYGNGAIDALAITGNAHVDNGKLVLEPEASYFTGTLTPDTAVSSVFNSSGASGNFSDYAVDLTHFVSPTLALAVSPDKHSVTASRAKNAYSRYVFSNNDVSLGRILDANAAHASGDAQHLFAALDFSSPDGSTIRNSLSSLSPAAYGQSALASLSLERQLSQAVLSRFASSAPDKNGKRLFAMPIGGHLNAHDGDQAYRSNYAGMLAGVEVSDKGTTAGAHVAAIHQSTRSGSAKMQGEGLWAGVHGTAAPLSWNGWQLSGLARLGIFKADMNRSIHTGTYSRSAESDWTQFSGTALAHVGYRLPLADKRFSILPFAGVDYAFLHQPSISEDKGKAARLQTDSQTYQSLRATVGLRAETAQQETASKGYTWRGNASFAYHREMLKHAGNVTARFIEMNGDFTTDARFASRSSVSASAGVSLTSSTGTTLDFQLASEFAPGHGTSFGGFGRVSWPF